MNIGKCKNRPKYVCDKCGKFIPYIYQKGFEVYKYYKQNKYDYSIKKILIYVKAVKRNLENG